MILSKLMLETARPIPIPLQGGSVAMFSGIEAASRAIVFVHGWGGSAIQTWHRFQGLVQENGKDTNWEWWNQSDLYFYGYESRRFSIDEHVGTFSRFLEQVFPTPRSIFGVARLDVPLTSDYEEIYLVGHSLGAVVIRKALLDRALKSERVPTEMAISPDPLMNARLRLFAPAMLGFRPSNWLGFCSYLLQDVPALGAVLRAARRSPTVIRQLDPDSAEIQELKRLTEDLARRNNSPAFAAHVIFGDSEQVVERGKYAYDEIGDPIPAHDHESVCKPNEKYMAPLDFIQKGVDYVAKHHRI